MWEGVGQCWLRSGLFVGCAFGLGVWVGVGMRLGLGFCPRRSLVLLLLWGPLTVAFRM
ncbi:hypothetical protein BDW59DRAFT_153219 [Aspergillus cavernicola]|uniref:Uncharacterized protein n=1 Tax=Aspergillus cavernicola TaxID=176166 RepID=A0ABR4HLQ1_9EURO